MKTKSFIFISLILCLSLLCSCAGGGEAPSVSAEAEPHTRSAILSPTADMGEGYIDDFVFFGESTTYHLKSRGVLSGGTDTSQVLHDKSGSAILNPETYKMKLIYRDGETPLPFGEAIAKRKPRYLLLTFGLNGASATVKRGKDYFFACYRSVISAARSASPETVIIIQSCFPVAENMDMSRYTVTVDGLNGYIRTINGWALELCAAEGLSYLDTQEILTDGRGRLRLEYQVGDGHHLNTEAYRKILEYVRTHGYCEGD